MKICMYISQRTIFNVILIKITGGKIKILKVLNINDI